MVSSCWLQTCSSKENPKHVYTVLPHLSLLFFSIYFSFFFFAVFNISPKINKMIQHFKMCKNENANRNQINKTKCSLKLKWKETPSPALQNNAVFWFSLIVYYMGCTSQLHNVLKFRDFNFKERWHKDIASVLRCLRSWIRPTILS